MQIKTFRGKSYSGLIRRIKKELGPEAVILSSDTVSSNEGKIHEVVAALENTPQDQPGTASENMIPRESGPSDNSQWRTEWENFKNSFYKIIKNNVSGPQITKRQKQILEYLEKQGVHPEVIMDLWSSLADNIDQPTLKILGTLVGTAPWKSTAVRSQVHAFIGPSGAGKTTTVLRLALEARRKNPGWKILLVNTDTQHAGGRLYLKHYASLSDISYKEAKQSADWQDLAAGKKAYDLILVDTPGLGSGNGTVISREIQELAGIACHMVLSPVYASGQIDHYLDFTSSLSLKTIIWTKIDEACSFGAMVNASWKTGLPISYFSFGKSLKESSSAATQENLWMLIFKKKMPEVRLQEQ
ncbi:MAG: hypothetical protein ACOCV7_04890 [Desulfonatronovibrionaceae bacterium]